MKKDFVCIKYIFVGRAMAVKVCFSVCDRTCFGGKMGKMGRFECIESTHFW